MKGINKEVNCFIQQKTGGVYTVVLNSKLRNKIYYISEERKSIVINKRWVFERLKMKDEIIATLEIITGECKNCI